MGRDAQVQIPLTVWRSPFVIQVMEAFWGSTVANHQEIRLFTEVKREAGRRSSGVLPRRVVQRPRFAGAGSV